MKKSILERKHWQIFLVFIFVQFLILPAIAILLFLFGHRIENLVARLIELFTTLTLYFSYPILVGTQLNRLLANQKKFSVTSSRFIVTCIIIMTTSYVVALTIGIVAPWDYLLPVIIIPCFLMVVSWPARPLKSIELRRNAGIWEYISDAFQFVAWPLAVWWLQPRLNEIEETKIVIAE